MTREPRDKPGRAVAASCGGRAGSQATGNIEIKVSFFWVTHSRASLSQDVRKGNVGRKPLLCVRT